MAEIVVEPVAQTLCESLITAIKEQLKYVCSYRTYIKDLDDGLTDLENARKRRQEEVARAHHNADDIYDDVTDWLDEVEKITQRAKEVIERHKNSKKGCFRGIIPNPSTRFLIAKEAEGSNREINKLKERYLTFQTVSHPKTSPGIVTGKYKGPEYWIAPSRASLLADISKALLDSSVRIVGVYGASGVGKSTLLKQLEKQVKERKLNYDFDAVTMATVSRSPEWEKIQDDLGYGLGLKTEKENTVVQKANRLWDRLSQKGKVLIILDDIWENIDLVKLGIPFDDNHPKIKLLLTSRSEQVLGSKMDSKYNFCVHPLEEGEAVDLFKNILGNQAGDDAKLIDELAKDCEGLPVLISPLATSLKSLPSSAWNEALTKLRRSNIENFIEESLEFNYHLIKSDEAKSLFLLCGQIGKQIIHIDDLIIYGLGLGLLRGVHTMEEAKVKVKLLVDNLKASGLLEDDSEGWVKLHDLMGEVALSIASKYHTSLVIRNDKMLKACFGRELRGCKSISMPYPDRIDELPEGVMCPELDMLLVYVTDARIKISDDFFENMRKLKVLDFTGMIFDLLPSSIQFLSELHTLCLDSVTVEDLKIIGKLKTLRVLTLRGSKISRLPKEIGALNNLILLDLTGCRNLEVIEPNVLGSLTHMEELHFPIQFDKQDVEAITKANLIELNNMPHLSNLTIWVQDAASLPIPKTFQQLERYKIYFGEHWDLKDHDEARTLKLELDSNSSKLIFKERMQTILKKTQDLSLHGLIGMEEIVAKVSKESFPELKHIHIESCPSIQYVMHSKKPDAFPMLESLSLCGLINLRKICKGDLPLKSLSYLKVMKIEACDELRNLLSFSSLKCLPMLEEVEVSDCTMIQEIITCAEMKHVDEEGVGDDKVGMLELKYLHHLKLTNLQNFSSFSSKGTRGESTEIVADDTNSQLEFLDGRQVSFPCLKSLILSELPKLRKISHCQYPANLHGLKSLELLKCKSLAYALDSNSLQWLKSLEFLTIEDCGLMETIFHMEELKPGEAPLQINLKLSNLPRLKKIWNENSQDVQSVFMLKKLEVSKCDGLENLFSSSMAKSLGKTSHISIASCMSMKEIFLEEEDDDPEIKFSSLSYLCISGMENLTMFSNGNHHYYRFPCLTMLIISDCPKMRALVSAKHGKEELSNEDAIGDEPFFSRKVMFTNLEELRIKGLEVKEIWPNKELASFHVDLKFLTVEDFINFQQLLHRKCYPLGKA